MPFDGKIFRPEPQPVRPDRSRVLLAVMIAVTAVVWLIGILVGPPDGMADRALAVGHWLFGFAVPAIAVIWLATWEPRRRDEL